MSRKDQPPPPKEALAAAALLTADYLLVITDDQFARADPSRPIPPVPPLPAPSQIKSNPMNFYGAVGQRYNALIEAAPHNGYRIILKWFEHLFVMPGSDKRTILQGKPLEKEKGKKAKPPVLSAAAQIMAKTLFPAKRRLMKISRDKTEYEKPSVPALVYTTSLDCLWQKAGFSSRELCTVDGDLIHWQCNAPCCASKYELDPFFRFFVESNGKANRLVPHDERIRQLLDQASPAQLVEARSAEQTMAVCSFCRENGWSIPVALPPVLPEPPLSPMYLAELDHRLFSYPGVMEPRPPHPATIGKPIVRPSALSLPSPVMDDDTPYDFGFGDEDEEYAGEEGEHYASDEEGEFGASNVLSPSLSNPPQSLYSPLSPTTMRTRTSAITSGDGWERPMTQATSSSDVTGIFPITSRSFVADAPLRRRTLVADRALRVSTAQPPNLPQSPGRSGLMRSRAIDTSITSLQPNPLSPSQNAFLSTSVASSSSASSSLTATSASLTPTASTWTARQSVLGGLSIIPPSKLVDAPFRTVSEYAPPPTSPTYASISPRNIHSRDMFPLNVSQNDLSATAATRSSASPQSSQFDVVLTEHRGSLASEQSLQPSSTSPCGIASEEDTGYVPSAPPYSIDSLARLVRPASSRPRTSDRSRGGSGTLSRSSSFSSLKASESRRGSISGSAESSPKDDAKRSKLIQVSHGDDKQSLLSETQRQAESGGELRMGAGDVPVDAIVDESVKREYLGSARITTPNCPLYAIRPSDKAKNTEEPSKQPLLPMHINIPRCPRCQRDCRPACKLSLNDRSWVGAKDQVAQYNRWIEAIKHEWEKEPNKSIVFLEIGIKQTSKLHTQLMALWKELNPSITMIRVGGGKIGAPTKKKGIGAASSSQSDEEDLTMIEVYNAISVFQAIYSIDAQMREIIGEFEFKELMMPRVM
ncbi:uncharacterized protein MONOS_2375 [Monocercomonoides exilis]|uniref:uncharacterized protein n=1 Tax=Monocercomonoides exilis TaxID=2049356 RepID=UPI00355A961D|nr:hypothetical protein MONOS_2375 [Monocercomonoides exilis]|eukprot:MONOS_2375.1-p1 / transcript=MONOS_2375.1 / gene=MONOS_2375 / organism=Monocercomonoides_exilis_PA203 / gene_product=unspecified product / transcript_product=unspecified product / location=Mono_scaffold00049:1673-4711(+) / protein_length=929 / sequence_SO=supercontig / SO=protein_coding / is_pseudo=false